MAKKKTHFTLQHPDGRTFNIKNELKDTVKKLMANGDHEGLERLVDEHHAVEARSGIHIKESKKGTFTAAAKNRGKGVQEFASQVLAHKENYSSAMVKKANFARNAAKWKHEYGGYVQPREGAETLLDVRAQDGTQVQQGDQQQQMQQIAQMVAQALQQGADPNQVLQMLVQQGVPQDVAQQVIQMVMQQMQGQQQAPQQEEMQQPAVEDGGEVEMAKSGKWIQKAVNPKHKGYCTPMTKKTCTPRRKALARTFKKHHGFHKAEDGMEVQEQVPMSQGTPQQGGQQQMEQIAGMVAQALQQGASPEQVLQMLVQQGVPQQVAQQVIAQVMQQLQGAQQQPQEEMQQAPQGAMGIRIKRAQLGAGLGEEEPMITENTNQSMNILGANFNTNDNTSSLTGKELGDIMGVEAPAFDPALTRSLVQRNRLKNLRTPGKYQTKPNLTPEEQQQYKDYKQQNRQELGSAFQTQMPWLVGSQYSIYNSIRNAGDARADQALLKQIESGNASGYTPEDIKGIKRDKGISTALATTYGLAAGIQGAMTGLNAYTTAKKEAANRKDYLDRMQLGLRDTAQVDKYSPGYETKYAVGPMSKWGGRITPCKECGGKMAYGGKLGFIAEVGHEIQNSAPNKYNVITERGEMINNGMSVYEDGGVAHDSARGGNYKYLMEGSVVHSKSRGTTPADLLNFIRYVHPNLVENLPQPETAKYGKKVKLKKYAMGGIVPAPEVTPSVGPDKLPEVSQEEADRIFVKDVAGIKNQNSPQSFAALLKKYNTTKEDKEIERTNKDIEKYKDKALNPTNTSIATATAKINAETEQYNKEAAEKSKAYKLKITGSEGILFNLAQADRDLNNLEGKTSKYGKKIALVDMPKVAAAMEMKAKFAQDGTGVNEGAPEGTRIKENYSDGTSDYIVKKGNKWYSQSTGEEADGTYDQDFKDYPEDFEGPVQSKIPFTGPQLPEIQYGVYNRKREEPIELQSRTGFLESRPSVLTGDMTKYPTVERVTQPVVTPPTNLGTQQPVTTGVTPVVTTPITQNLGQLGPVSTESGVTKWTPKSVTNFRGTQWTKGDQPTKEQQQLGFKPHFNDSPYYQDPVQGLNDLVSLGFEPSKYGKNWENFSALDVQNHLVDWSKQHDWAGVKDLYDYYRTTKHAPELQGKVWDELEDSEKEKFMEDDKYGVRTYLLGKFMKSKQGPATTVAVEDRGPLTDTGYKGGPIEKGKKKSIYYDPLHPMAVAGPLMSLLTPRDVTPFIEDTGAKDALAASTRRRFTEIQPQLNRLRRATLAQTRGVGMDPVRQAQQAQAYANEYEAAAQAYGEKYNKDAAIEKEYIDVQNQLRREAGANRAKALDLLARREATSKWKKTAMDINALNTIADRYLKNRAENRASFLYQDMFPNVAYRGDVTYTTSDGAYPYATGSSTPLTKEQIDYKKSMIDLQLKEQEAKEKGLPGYTKKYGGKIKLPKKSVKRMKSVR